MTTFIRLFYCAILMTSIYFFSTDPSPIVFILFLIQLCIVACWELLTYVKDHGELDITIPVSFTSSFYIHAESIDDEITVEWGLLNKNQ